MLYRMSCFKFLKTPQFLGYKIGLNHVVLFVFQNHILQLKCLSLAAPHKKRRMYQCEKLTCTCSANRKLSYNVVFSDTCLSAGWMYHPYGVTQEVKKNPRRSREVPAEYSGESARESVFWCDRRTVRRQRDESNAPVSTNIICFLLVFITNRSNPFFLRYLFFDRKVCVLCFFLRHSVARL